MRARVAAVCTPLGRGSERMPTIRCRGTIPLALALACLGGASRADEPPPAIPEGEIRSPAGLEEPGRLFEAEDAEEAEEAEDAETDEFEAAEPVRDPLEPANRAIFGFNQKVDRWFWTPITDAYQFVA